MKTFDNYNMSISKMQRLFTMSMFRFDNLRIVFLLFVFLIISASGKVLSNTDFDPTKTSHLSISINSGLESYNYVSVKILAYDYGGVLDDVMRDITVWFEEDNGTWTQIEKHISGHNDIHNTITSTNTDYAGYISNFRQTSSDKLRFTEYTWQYPQRLSAKKVRMKVYYSWDIDHTTRNLVQGYYLGISLNFPAFAPKINSSSFIPQANNNVLFSFNKDASSSYINKVYLYSDQDRTNLLKDFDVLTDAASGSITFPWNNSFTEVSNLYVTYGLILDKKNYTYNSTTTNNSYIKPVSVNPNYDNCSKKITLTWIINNNGGISSSDGLWVVERKEKSQSDYSEIANSLSATTNTYVDESCQYDKEYNYRVRFIPNGMEKTRILSEFAALTEVKTKRTVLNTLNFTTYTKTSAENPKIVLKWTPNWCYNPSIIIQRKNDVTGAITDLTVTSSNNNNTNTYTDENLTENVLYHYRLVVNNEGVITETAWQDVMIKDEVKYKSVIASKGTMADRIQLKWNVERNDLSNSFFIKRQIFDEDVIAPIEDITNITTNGKYYSYDDRNISPGVLYKYRLGSEFTLQSGAIDTVYYDGDIIGFAQASGTISGRVTFGSGTSVDSVSIFASNANESESLYRSISFNGSGGLGEIALSPEKHGCPMDGFSWQAWLMPLDAQAEMAVYECLKEFSVWYEGSKLDVYLDQVSASIPLLSYDMSSLKQGDYFHTSITFDGDADLRLYIDGKLVQNKTLTAIEKAKINKCENTILRPDTTIAYVGNGFLVKGSFKGNIDDLRLWDHPITAKEIADNYNRYINGSETGLIGYWQFDEGLKNYAFDRSNYKKIYNEHHISFTKAESSKVVPSLEQLSIKGTTDKNGNYLISGIPFTGDGSTYAFTPSKSNHEFEPSQLNRYLTYQTSVHNAVDFEDVSSFEVKIQVTYKNTTFPSDSVNILIDGNNVFKGKNIMCTDAFGECVVEVPIGTHTITVEKRGHTFVDGDNNKSISMNFKEPITGNPLKFYDTTKSIVAGRVVGGVVQGSLPIGFGLSRANIGEAEITLEVPDGDYQLNPTSSSISVSGAIQDTINSVATILAGAKEIKVTTDPKTGEFRLSVPPLKYKVTNITTRGELTGSDFNLLEFQVDPNVEKSDTATINNLTKKFKYNQKLNFTYRTPNISINVIDPDMPERVFGDSIFDYLNLTNNTTQRIPLYEFLDDKAETPNYDEFNKPQYKYNYPIYRTNELYKFRIFAYEQYQHPDNSEEMAEFCKVPCNKATLNIQNNLGRYELLVGSDGNPQTEGDEIETKEYTFNEEGIFDYSFKAGFPNLIAPYTLGLSIAVEYEGHNNTWDGNTTFNAIVLGDIITGTDFVTQGPDLISFVLRDPPGSNSYSYMEKGTTISNSFSFNKSYVGSESAMGTINYGQCIKVAYGVGVAKIEELEIKNQTGVGVEVEQSSGNGDEFNITTTTTERIETSSSPDYVGRRGDVYVGASTNLFYGTSRRLCPVFDENGNYVLNVIDGNVGHLTTETNYRYTYAHITETLIPNLKKLRNDLLEPLIDTVSATAYEITSRYVTQLSKDNIDYGKEGTYRFIEPLTKTENQYENEIQKYNMHINDWVSKLGLYEDEKANTMDSNDDNYNKTNVSADAGVSTENSITICGSSTQTHTGSYKAQGVVKSENGFAYNKLGFQFEIETKHGAERETVRGEGAEYCTTYGYVIADENPGDYISVDVYTPKVETYNIKDDDLKDNDLNNEKAIRSKFDTYSGAPIFVTRGGRTSCPYEPKEIAEYSDLNKDKELGVATLQVEKPDLKVAEPFATDISSGKEASYKITLSNLSESNTAGWYMLSVDEQTNSKGAIISVDGQTLGNGKLYYIVPGTPMEKVLKLKQSSLDELEYNNIGLTLGSTCDDISSSISLSAQFIPSCSDVTIEIANKTVNSTTSDVLPIKIKDYNKDYNNFGGILLQYKTINQDENAWTTIRKFINDPTILETDQNSEIITASTINYQYPMNGKDDQTYQFRAITVCAYGTELVNNESEIITVIKDMVTPTALGSPSPSNGILTPESEVSITFNEEIQNSILNSTNMKVEAVLNGNTLKHNVGLEFTGTNNAYTEQQFNLQSVPVSIEAWIKTNQLNSNGTLFAIGEGANQLKLQLNANTLKAIAGTEEFTGNINADEDWQYLSIGYNPNDKKLTVNVNGQFNNNVKVIDQSIVGSIEPSGRLSVGTDFVGNITQLSVWMKDRDLTDMSDDMNISKSGNETGLIGYWPLNEGSGSLAADKINSRNLVLKTGWYLEPKGKAIQLNGSNQNVLITTATTPVTKDQDLTLEFWFKAGNQTNKTLFSCGKGINEIDSINSLSVGFDANGKLTVYSKGNTHLISTTDYQDNQWHHFAMSVLRRGNTNVFVDGISKYQVISTRFGGLSANKMSIGARYYKIDNTSSNYTTDQYFAGQVDEVRIWKAALTAENIRLDMNNKLTGFESGLIAYYPFEEYTVNGANQNVIVGSLKDAFLPSNTSDIESGGTATGSAEYSDITPAIKEARTKENVYFNWTSTNNKIVFNILEPLKRIENCVLEFTVERVLDLNGNRMAEPVMWTVFVDNNRLKWEADGESLKKEVLAPLTFKTTIVNSSGKYENYVIDGLPSWLSVNKSSGSLNPLGKTELTFTVDNSINVGSYESRITLTGINGIQEMFPVSLKVTGPRPDWTVNPYDFESSMNIIGQLKIEDVYQEDTEDILAAFIGTKCVGIVSSQFNKTLNSYILYMDVYGNSEDANKELTFSLWDAGTGRIYPDVDVVGGSLTFSSGSIIGSVAIPKIFNATDKVEQQLNIKKGWNWISTNVVNSAPSLIDQIKDAMEVDGISLKSKTLFSNYSATSASWSGSLTSVNQRSMYLLRSGLAKTVKVIGATAKSVEFPITISSGWNWIGYVPQFVAPINEALSSINAVDGDQIKGQVGFATYSGSAWYGSLQYLVPGQGYMFNSVETMSRTLTYPSQYISRSNVRQKTRNDQVMHWTYNEYEFPQNMTVTAVVEIDDVESVNENLQVAAFIDNNCRGTINLILDPSTNRYYAYLTILGDGVADLNKKITIKCFNPANNIELEAADKSIGYISDSSVGAAESPYVISFSNSTTGQSEFDTDNRIIYPNPVVNVLNFSYDPKGIELFEIVDCTGRIQYYSNVLNKSSVNVSKLLPGIYTLRVNYKGENFVHRFIKN